jgi:hypothetical protein
MTDDDFDYDIFFSFNEHDAAKVEKINKDFRDNGLRSFFAPDNLSGLVGTPRWKDAIFDAITKSHHLGVYCSKDAAFSSWVIEEVTRFRTSAKNREGVDQRILVISDPSLYEKDLEHVLSQIPGLENVLRPTDAAHAMRIVTSNRIRELSSVLSTAKVELSQARNLARQTFEYYRHARFWKPFTEPSGQDLHIFTCGHDTAEGTDLRGPGGRTSIDKWDYLAVVDITDHFARHYRDIDVVIEQPVSKTRIDEETRTFDTAEFTQKLMNRNCILVGSPDVSDFSEITLASLLKVKSYSPKSQMTTGFRIRKGGRRYFSTFYEDSPAEHTDGIRLIRHGQPEEFFVSDHDRDHGVLILADNPFSDPSKNCKTLILAGHTGTATRAMSLLLTNEEPWCMEAFYALEQDFAVMSGPIAAVIEVKYERIPGRDPKFGDDRVINSDRENIRVCTTMALHA